MTFVSYEGYEPAHFSYSTMDGYRSCGERTRLQKVLHLEQVPGLAGIGGNAVHTATEWYDLGTMGEKFDPIEAFNQAWTDEINKRREQSPNIDPGDYIATGRAGKEYGGKRNAHWWADHGPSMVQAWVDWRTSSGWSLWETPEGRPAVELQINFILPNDIPILLFIDRVMVTPAGQLVLLDIKTGRTPETPEQLGLYACGIASEWGDMFRPAWGYWWTPDKGQSTPLSLDGYTVDYYAHLATQAAAGMNAGVFMAKPQNNCRAWCGSARWCTAVGGHLPDGV